MSFKIRTEYTKKNGLHNPLTASNWNTLCNEAINMQLFALNWLNLNLDMHVSKVPHACQVSLTSLLSNMI